MVPNPPAEVQTTTQDPMGISKSMLEVQQAWLNNPELLYSATTGLVEGLYKVNSNVWSRFWGAECEHCISPSEYDSRFQDQIWFDNPVSDIIKEYYLLYTRWIENQIYTAPNLPKNTIDKAGFWARQWLNFIAPTNFFWLNPKAIATCAETGGRSLRQGFANLYDDMQQQTISMVDKSKFTVGKNLATTPGAVVFRNELFELLQYSPTTAQVKNEPILFVPPWINKYYILDLNPGKSMVKYLVDQGFTVFMISWRNPTAAMRNTEFSSYIIDGALKAVEVVNNICSTPQCHAVGYCIGGTALSILMAYLNAKYTPEKNPISDWTLLCSLQDFSNPGEIEVFIDEDTIKMLEAKMAETGYLDGKDMEHTFRLLRSNSLIWNYVVHQYLYGEPLGAFDVLFWNTDNTRMPERMHSYYLRELYLNNKLVQPGGIKIANTPIDLSKIKQPLYAVGTEQDHITPWKETFKVCNLISGPVRYALATSGHIVGVLTAPENPPKRRFWVGDATGATDANHWCQQQEKIPGSWWEDWVTWLTERSSETIAARATLGNKTFPELIKAPGKYVFEK